MEIRVAARGAWGRGRINSALLLLLLSPISVTSMAADSKPVLIPNSAWTGQDFHDHPGPVRELYVTGLIDGMHGAPILGGDVGTAHALHDCVLPMKGEQLTAVLARYVDAHPESWHWSMHILANLALRDACPELASAESRPRSSAR